MIKDKHFYSYISNPINKPFFEPIFLLSKWIYFIKVSILNLKATKRELFI